MPQIDSRIIFAVLAIYGFAMALGLFYGDRRFRRAGKILDALQREWVDAESSHTNLMSTARERVSRFAWGAEGSTGIPALARTPVSFDLRNQVVAMARKGASPLEISRICAIPLPDIDVLLGMARIEKA